MKLFNETPFPIRNRRSAIDPEHMFLTIVVKGTFTFGPDGVCEPLPQEQQPKIEAARNFMDRHGNSRMTDSDMVPFKPRADCLFIGSAVAPGGKPVDGLTATFGIGDMRKSLSVWGDRQWVREPGGSVRLEGPVPFAAMPIRSELAHGGPTSAFNQHGIGFGELPEEPGATLKAANILPADVNAVPWDRDEMPAGFGVLAPNLLPRRALAGTYDSDWNFRRRPLPPADFDTAFFNGAPADQQIDGFLKGDEEIHLENLHPRSAAFKGRLPGIRVRCFVNRTWPHGGIMQEEFTEVLTNLDTCIVDVADGLVTLIWRGTLEIVSRKLERIHYMMVTSEPVDAPQTREHYLDKLRQLILASLPPKPETELSDEKKKKIAEMNRKGIEDMAETLRQGKADASLVEGVLKQPTVDDALKFLTAHIEEITKALPKAEE